MKLTVEQRLEMACLTLEFYGHAASCIDPELGHLTNLRTGELLPLQANAIGRPELQEWALTFTPKDQPSQQFAEVSAKSSLDQEPD